jgi:hypothetical protein
LKEEDCASRGASRPSLFFDAYLQATTNNILPENRNNILAENIINYLMGGGAPKGGAVMEGIQ